MTGPNIAEDLKSLLQVTTGYPSSVEVKLVPIAPFFLQQLSFRSIWHNDVLIEAFRREKKRGTFFWSIWPETYKYSVGREVKKKVISAKKR